MGASPLHIDLDPAFQLPHSLVALLVGIVQVVHEVGHIIPSDANDGRVKVDVRSRVDLHAFHGGAEEAPRGPKNV